MMGSDSCQTTREKLWLSMVGRRRVNRRLRTLQRASRPRADWRRRHAQVSSGDQRDLVGMSVQVHYHARQQGAALVKLAELEVRHFQRQVRDDVLQPPIFLQFESIVLSPGF